MTKTQRRRRDRARREDSAGAKRSVARRSHQAAVSFVTEHDWKQLESTLESLLDIDIPNPFCDRELLCPEEVWILVKLDCVPSHIGRWRNLRGNIARVLAAVAKICIFSEVLRSWDDLFVAFWRRLARSSMLDYDFDMSEPRVVEVITAIKHRGIHIAIQWRDRHFLAEEILEPVRDFLDTPFQSEQSRIPVQVGLRFQHCELTVDDLERIHTILKTKDERRRLCCVDTLQQLCIGENELEASHLGALAAILEDPATRRIDSLDLAGTTSDNSLASFEYATSFERVLLAAVREKTSDISTSSDRGVSISLAHCKHIQPEHVDALHNALARATRPVRALSLSRTTLRSYTAWSRFYSLILSPPRTATEDFLLDIGDMGWDENENSVSVQGDPFVSLAELVHESIPRINTEGILARVPVTCRLRNSELFSDPYLTEHVDEDVPLTTFYHLVEATHQGHFRIVLPSSSSRLEATAAWVTATSISNIRIGDKFIVGSPCTSLVLDRTAPNLAVALTEIIGSRVTRLSLRGRYFGFLEIPIFLKLCPFLQELNAEASQAYTSTDGPNIMWPDTPSDTGVHLRVLNLRDCWLSPYSLRSLTPLPSLKRLILTENNIGAGGLENLAERLRSNRALNYVDVSLQWFDEDDDRCTQARAAIVKLLQEDTLSIRGKAAFLSVLAKFEEHSNLRQRVPRDVTDVIFAFATTNRTVIW